MNVVLTAAGIVAGLVAVDRLLLAFERRGWIHYRKGRGSSGALGSAVLEAQKLLEPSVRHVVEERRSEPVKASKSGETPPEVT